MKQLLLASAALLCAGAARAAPVHAFLTIALSPDGKRIASIEGDEDAAGMADIRHVVIRALAGGNAVTVKLPCGEVRECTPSSLAWAPDSQHLSFVLRSPGSHDHAIYTVGADGTGLSRSFAFTGTLVDLTYGPGGKMAVLATANAAKEVGAVEAGAPVVGVLGADVHEQRVATLGDNGALTYASPPGLFVYQYDWLPNGGGFVGTAAPGDGDDNWWTAKLYRFDAAGGAARVIYAPTSPQQQLQQPIVSPDGTRVAFIGGLMSDFGPRGGGAYLLSLDKPGAAEDITPDWPATITALNWNCDSQHLRATVLHGAQTQLMEIGLTPSDTPPDPIWSGEEMLRQSDGWTLSSSCHAPVTAVVHQSFTTGPEIAVGPAGHWQDLTHVNADQKIDVQVTSLDWQSGPWRVQGWLLQPPHKDDARLPMITVVHGGPAWANQPSFLGQSFNRHLLDAGYALLLPNPRGSFGQGEAFTKANVKDFGYGDLQDILAGVTQAEHAAPIDDGRLGITGWSYGGYMTMFAVTQTDRFHAAVAGAGISDWLSYYGENGIDEWMIPYFGASVYADPAVYAKSSPITFIRNVRTPTLEVVGANDVECPPPQTEEFWHALHDLGVPTESVIYPGEGHGMRKPADVADYQKRALGWFAKYLGTSR